jgi:hypothetical protein
LFDTHLLDICLPSRAAGLDEKERGYGEELVVAAVDALMRGRALEAEPERAAGRMLQVRWLAGGGRQAASGGKAGGGSGGLLLHLSIVCAGAMPIGELMAFVFVCLPATHPAGCACAGGSAAAAQGVGAAAPRSHRAVQPSGSTQAG